MEAIMYPVPAFARKPWAYCWSIGCPVRPLRVIDLVILGWRHVWYGFKGCPDLCDSKVVYLYSVLFVFLLVFCFVCFSFFLPCRRFFVIKFRIDLLDQSSCSERRDNARLVQLNPETETPQRKHSILSVWNVTSCNAEFRYFHTFSFVLLDSISE